MKPLTNVFSKKWMLFTTISIFIFSACQRQIDKPTQQEEISTVPNNNNGHGHLQQTKNYSAEVALKWMDMQLRLFRTNATPLGGLPPQRFYAYSAIALYESVVPGMPAYQTLSGQLTDMPEMPQTLPGFAYHWPTCANAALAAMSKKFLANTSVANKNAMDSLENALNTIYQAEINN